jgi:phage shock protein PspC (stress-responsive transcriptional regulator)
MTSPDSSVPPSGTTAPPTDPPPATSPAGGTGLRPPLRRSRDHRVVAGVCGGLGEYFGVDPVLFRVVAVVLTLFGGWGVLLYGLAWLVIPDAPRAGAPDGRTRRSGGIWWIVGLAVLALIVLPWALAVMRNLWWNVGGYRGFGMPMAMPLRPLHLFWPGAGSLLLLVGAGAVIWWLVRRDAPSSRQVPPPTGASPTSMASGPPAVESTVYPAAGSLDMAQTESTIAFAPASTWTDPAAPPPSAPEPPPRRVRSVLGPLTVSVAVLVAGVLLALDTAGNRSVPVAVILATTLAIVALGLLVGARVGRSRGLIVLGVLLSLATAAVAALPHIDLSGGVGHRTYVVRTDAQNASPYRLGAGNVTLNLAGLTAPGTHFVDAGVGVGTLTVYVPQDADLAITAHVGLGGMQWQGPNSASVAGRNVSKAIEVKHRSSTETITLDVSVDVGQITVIPQGRL